MANEFIVKKGLKVNGSVDVTGTVDGRDVATDGAKLDNIVVTQAVNLDTIESDTATNNVKVGITSAQASDITANNAKVGITPTQASNITTNNAKVSDINHNVTTNLSTSTAATTVTVVSSDGTNAVLPAATTTVAGMLTGTDKSKLNGIASGATANTGDITGVTAGTGMSGGGTSGTVTLTNSAPNIVQTSVTGNAGTVTNGVYTTGTQTVGGAKTFTDPVVVSGGHGSARHQVKFNYNGTANHAHNGFLTSWTSEPGITYYGSGIGANINLNGQYYGRQETGQPYGCYVRFAPNNGYIEFHTTTGVPGTGGGQGGRRAYITPAGAFTATGNVTAYSDIRIKDNIEVIPDALSKVKQISGYTYTRTDLEDKEEKFTGVIAQEVLKVLPEAVILGEKEEDTMSVAYGNMVGLLIESIKELELRVKELENK